MGSQFFSKEESRGTGPESPQLPVGARLFGEERGGRVDLSAAWGHSEGGGPFCSGALPETQPKRKLQKS